jgi:hypothetical protein
MLESEAMLDNRTWKDHKIANPQTAKPQNRSISTYAGIYFGYAFAVIIASTGAH